jgi:hypothetical protein
LVPSSPGGEHAGAPKTSGARRRLVDDLHSLSVHSTTVSRESRASSFDLAKIGRRQVNIDRSQGLVQATRIARAWDGTIHGFCASSQAGAICAGVAFFFSANLSARQRTADLPRGSIDVAGRDRA